MRRLTVSPVIPSTVRLGALTALRVIIACGAPRTPLLDLILWSGAELDGSDLLHH